MSKEADLESLTYVCEPDDDGDVETIEYPEELTRVLPDLIAKNKRVFLHATAIGLVAYKRASDIDYRAITAAKFGGKDIQLIDAQAKCGFTSVLWPSRQVFASLCEDYPGIPVTIGILAWSEAQGDRRSAKKKP